MPTELLLSDGGKKAIVRSGPASAPRVEAQLTGSLEQDGAGCIIIRADDGDDWTLVFPEGTNFDGESLVLPDSSSLSDGISVALDGARVPANESLSMCLNYARLLSVEKATVIPK
ncbi:1-acyl-sn-glycerol-3-phosphate acyltransferase [Arthrobacter sp. UYEF20]